MKLTKSQIRVLRELKEPGAFLCPSEYGQILLVMKDGWAGGEVHPRTFLSLARRGLIKATRYEMDANLRRAVNP
jgi:hypothetical protein